MKAQQLAIVLLASFLCVHGQRYIPYGVGTSGIQTGQVPAANIIRAPPLPNVPVSPGPAVNLNLPIGRSFKTPEGAYGVGSVVQNGRLAIPAGATVAANGNGRLTEVLGLGSLYIERGANGGSLTTPGRLVRIQKRSPGEIPDTPIRSEDLITSESELSGAAVLPKHLKKDEYDRTSLYRLAKEALKKNPRKGISFKKPEGSYGVGSVFEGHNPRFSEGSEKHKKFEAKLSREYPVHRDALSSPDGLVGALADHSKGVSYKKPEGEYGVSSVFEDFGLFNPFFHRRQKRQAVGSGSVTAVLVDFDKDDSAPQPPLAPTSSFAPVVGFMVQEPEGGTPSKHILKNVIYRKRPGGLKPSDVPTKPVLRIPDSIELPPLGGVPDQAGEESPDIQTVALPAAPRVSAPPKPIVSRKATSTATIEFRPTFPVENIPPALPPLPRPSSIRSKTSHFHGDTHGPKKTTPKPVAETHKLGASPLVAVPPGQVVYNRQLASSVPVQPVRTSLGQSRPPAVPTQVLRPGPTAQRVFNQPQAQVAAPGQPQLHLQPNVVAAAPGPAAAPQPAVHVQPQLQTQPRVIAAPQAPAPQLQAVAAAPYPGALYQQYTPLDPSTYQVGQPGQIHPYQHNPYAFPYATIVADPYGQARIARSTAGRLRYQASPFDASSVYDLSKRIIQGVHS
ncbi:uncharacterized protein LOC144098542 [Amblyomma americanum]